MQEPSKETTGSARDASEDVLPAAEADVGQPETLQDNDVGHMEDQSMEDQSMVSLDKGCERLQQALSNRDATKTCGLQPKAKAAPKIKAVPKGKAKAKATAKGKPTPKAIVKDKATAKAAAAKPTKADTKNTKKVAAKGKPTKADTKNTKKVAKPQLKMTRECVYSRSYHAAFRSLAGLLLKDIWFAVRGFLFWLSGVPAICPF